jgi:AraC family transcriptional regulator of adaptative response / DNA-3-methyladenine glycosylase II
MRALADETGRRPTPAELIARAEAWRPWRAYAALHLWSSEPQSQPQWTHSKETEDDRDAA